MKGRSAGVTATSMPFNRPGARNQQPQQSNYSSSGSLPKAANVASKIHPGQAFEPQFAGTRLVSLDLAQPPNVTIDLSKNWSLQVSASQFMDEELHDLKTPTAHLAPAPRVGHRLDYGKFLYHQYRASVCVKNAQGQNVKSQLASLEKASDQLLKAHQLRPESLEVHFKLGKIFLATGQYQQGITHLRFAAYPGHLEARRVENRINTLVRKALHKRQMDDFMDLVRKGRFAPAKEIVQKWPSKLYNSHIEKALYTLGQEQAKNGFLQEACSSFQGTRSAQSGFDLVIRCFLKRGGLQDLKSAAKIAMASEGENPDIIKTSTAEILGKIVHEIKNINVNEPILEKIQFFLEHTFCSDQ